MKKPYILLFSIFLSACNIQKQANSGKQPNLFEHKEFMFTIRIIDSTVKYECFIPGGYRDLFFIQGDGEEICYLFTYNDSSLVYISDDSHNPNYFNIQSLGESVLKKRFESTRLNSIIAKDFGNQYSPETIINNGIDSLSLNWKDIREGYISYGYLKVNNCNLELFEIFTRSVKKVKIY